MANVFFACCFCGQSITRLGPDPCSLVINSNDGHDQLWHCHAGCFKAKIAKDPPILSQNTSEVKHVSTMRRR